MKYIKATLIVMLVLAMALPAVAGRTVVKDQMEYYDLLVRQLNVTGGLIKGGVNTTGNIWYVDSNITNSGDGTSKDKAFKTLAEAITAATASNGDVIVGIEGSTFALTSAGAADASKIGLTFLGLGYGMNRPKINFTTATSSSLDITAASVTFYNWVIDLNGIDALTQPIDVAAADFTFIGNTVLGSDATYQPTQAIVLGGGADRARIMYNEFIYTTATGASAAIWYTDNGSCDNTEIAYNKIYGDFSTAPIVAAYTGTQNSFHDNVLTNYNAGDFAIELSGTLVTRSEIYNNTVSTDQPNTAIDPGATVAKLTGNMWDRYGGTDSGRNRFELFSGGERTWTVSALALPTVDYTTSIFSVTGPIEIMSFCGVVTTVIQAQANAAIIGYSPNSLEQKTIIGGSLDINGHKLGSVYTIPGTVGGTLTNSVDNGALIGQEDGQTLIVPAGWLGIHCAATNTGNITWTLRYRPITAEAVAYTTAN